MADFTYSGPASRRGPTRRLATFTNWAGAAVSLALVAGVGVWGVKLILRDVSGVPVVLAAEGPMRVAPENPGGESADHQGLSVNDVAGNGIASDPADRLTLAPRPLELAAEDVALGLPDPEEQAALADVPVAPAAVTLGALDGDPFDLDDSGDVAPSGQTLVSLTVDGADITEDDTDTGNETEEPSAEDAEGAAINDAIAAALSDAIPREIAGVARSLRPQLRPGGLQRTVSLAPLMPPASETLEIDPESLTAGTRLAQLGAFDSADTARGEWRRLEARFSDYMEGKDRVIERATSGGRVFYRLRVHGFDSVSEFPPVLRRAGVRKCRLHSGGRPVSRRCGAAILGCDGLVLTPQERDFFRDSNPFGFILFARNVDSADQIRALCDALRNCVGREAPIFVDQEGGRVQRLRPPLAREWPAPLDHVARHGAHAGRAMYLRYRIIAAELRGLGIDGNCAPMLDVARPRTHAFLRNRCYGETLEQVVEIGCAVAQAHLDGGVLPVLKHMPGHGLAQLDSHLALPRITADATTLQATDFAAFRPFSQMPLGMTAHLVYDAFDPLPATVSPRMIQMIRTDLCFSRADHDRRHLDGGASGNGLRAGRCRAGRGLRRRPALQWRAGRDAAPDGAHRHPERCGRCACASGPAGTPRRAGG